MPAPRLILACLLLLSLLAAATRADSAATRAPQRISGETPLPLAASGPNPLEQGWHPPEVGWCGTDRPEQDWEQDNSLALNPANSNNLAVAWTQDWADAIVVGYSKDGGATWSKSIPPTTPCTGGPTILGTLPGAVSALDPSLSFGPDLDGGPDGRAYLTSVVQGHALKGGLGSALALNTSTDGGANWTKPVMLDTAGEGYYLDASSVVADPARAGVAYAKWDKGDWLTWSERKQYVARTVDGGATWTPLPPVTGSTPGRLPLGGQLLLLRDGTLVNVAAELPPQPDFFSCFCVTGAYTATVRRLENPSAAGSTWSAPVEIPGAVGAIGIVDASLAPDGNTIVAAWPQPSSSAESFQVMLSKSVDGGRSWTPGAAAGPTIKGPVTTGSNGTPSQVAVSVAAEGTVGVMFYDHRLDEGNDPPQETDVWLRYSRNYLKGGASWREDHLAGSFDKTTAPGGVLADFNGITPFARGFAVTFSAAQPMAEKNTDIFFSVPAIR